MQCTSPAAGAGQGMQHGSAPNHARRLYCSAAGAAPCAPITLATGAPCCPSTLQWHDLLEIWEEQEVSWQRFMHNESLQWQQKKAGFQEQWAAVARRVEMHQGQPAAAPAPAAAAAGETGPAQVHLQQGDTTASEPAPGPAGPQPMQAAAAATQVGPAGATAAQRRQVEGRSAEEGPAPVAAQLEASHSAEGPHPAVRLPHAVLPAAQPMRLRRQALAAGKRRRAQAGGEGEQDELAGAEQSASSAVPLGSVRGSGHGASLHAACWSEHRNRTCMRAGSVCSALPLLGKAVCRDRLIS